MMLDPPRLGELQVEAAALWLPVDLDCEAGMLKLRHHHLMDLAQSLPMRLIPLRRLVWTWYAKPQ